MPIFEYKCPQCGALTEKIVQNAEDRDKTRTHCPKCRVKMEPVPISQPAPFRWGKGGGWN
jgi:putative FmdB family regulatory protein